MKTASRSIPTVQLVLCALFAVLTAVCAQVNIVTPFSLVPVSLSLLPVLLCGGLLEARYALLSMGCYLLMGLIGLPVFSGFSGGAARLFGVTGGYLVGYLPCVLCIALITRRLGRGIAVLCAAMAAGVVSCYVLGTIWFMALQHVPLSAALASCVVPFLPFDAVKIVLAAFLVRRLEGPLQRFIH